MSRIMKKYWSAPFMGVWIFCRIVGIVTETMIKDYIDKQKDSLDEIFKIVK